MCFSNCLQKSRLSSTEFCFVFFFPRCNSFNSRLVRFQNAAFIHAENGYFEVKDLAVFSVPLGSRNDCAFMSVTSFLITLEG